MLFLKILFKLFKRTVKNTRNCVVLNKRIAVRTYVKNVESRISLSTLSPLNALFHATLPAQILQKSFRELVRANLRKETMCTVCSIFHPRLSRHVAPVKPRAPLNWSRLEPRAARRRTPPSCAKPREVNPAQQQPSTIFRHPAVNQTIN